MLGRRRPRDRARPGPRCTSVGAINGAAFAADTRRPPAIDSAGGAVDLDAGRRRVLGIAARARGHARAHAHPPPRQRAAAGPACRRPRRREDRGPRGQPFQCVRRASSGPASTGSRRARSSTRSSRRPPCPGCCRRPRSAGSTSSTAGSSTRSRVDRAVELGATRIFVLHVGRLDRPARAAALAVAGRAGRLRDRPPPPRDRGPRGAPGGHRGARAADGRARPAALRLSTRYRAADPAAWRDRAAGPDGHPLEELRRPARRLARPRWRSVAQLVFGVWLGRCWRRCSRPSWARGRCGRWRSPSATPCWHAARPARLPRPCGWRAGSARAAARRGSSAPTTTCCAGSWAACYRSIGALGGAWRSVLDGSDGPRRWRVALARRRAGDRAQPPRGERATRCSCWHQLLCSARAPPPARAARGAAAGPADRHPAATGCRTASSTRAAATSDEIAR